jgi:hypothetical protein
MQYPRRRPPHSISIGGLRTPAPGARRTTFMGPASPDRSGAREVLEIALSAGAPVQHGTLRADGFLQSWLSFISSEMQLGCFCPLFDQEIPLA